MRTGELYLYESARNAHYLDHWAFEPHMESIPGSSAGASRQARHRRTQYPPIKAQPSVQPGDSVEKAAGCEDRLRAFAKTGGLAPRSPRFAKHGLAQCLISRLC